MKKQAKMIFLIIVAVFVLVITSVCVTIYCNNHQKTLSYDLKDFNSIVGASGQITSDNAEEYGNCGENKYFLKDGIFVIRGSGSVDYEEIPIEAIKSDSENGWLDIIDVVVVEEGISSLQRGTLSNMNMQTVILPDTINTIEKNLFYDCASLENLYIPTSVSHIESYAFHGCDKLNHIEWNEKTYTSISDFYKDFEANGGTIGWEEF